MPDQTQPGSQTQPGILPLRPLTTGEVLDAAVLLLRTRAGQLLRLGAAVALTEQVMLFPLRRLADLDARYLPATDSLAAFGVMVVVSLATEAYSITLLGGVAATGAPQALLGPAAPAQRSSRSVSVLLVGLVAALSSAAAGFSFLVLPVPLQVAGLVLSLVVTALAWPLVYGLLGLAAPVAVVDQLGPVRAVLRSVALSCRTGGRALWVRLLGYLAWLAIRLGLYVALLAVVALVYSSPSNTVDNLLMAGAWLAVNTLAYPVLGCLDVMLHLETRMRTEGLDIGLHGALRRGVSADLALAVPRRAEPAGGLPRW